MLTVGLFFCYTGGYAFWFWMPTMLQRLTGWTDVQRIGWIGAIPFVAGLIGMLLLGWNSDRTRERRWHFAIPQLTAALALSAWFFLPSFERTAHRGLHADWVRHRRLSAIVSGRFPLHFLPARRRPRQSGSSIARPASADSSVQRSSANLSQRTGSFQYRIYFHDRVLDDRVSAGAALPARATDALTDRASAPEAHGSKFLASLLCASLRWDQKSWPAQVAHLSRKNDSVALSTRAIQKANRPTSFFESRCNPIGSRI